MFNYLNKLINKMSQICKKIGCKKRGKPIYCNMHTVPTILNLNGQTTTTTRKENILVKSEKFKIK